MKKFNSIRGGCRIDFKKLDKRRIYLGLQYGKNSIIAKEIIKFTKCYAPYSDEIPTHVLAFVYRLKSWWIYESHANGHEKLGLPSGVRRYKLEKWLEVEKKTQDEFKAVPLDISFSKLEEYIGYKYGLGDLQALLGAAIFRNNGKQKDHDGLICSEYISLCYPKIQEYLLLHFLIVH